MTDIEIAASTDVATTGPGGGVEGLEDFDNSDLVMPRLKINHTEAAFEDNLSGSTYEGGIEVILLGLIKQRVLWPPEPGGDNERPLCKSFDFRAGVPGDSFPAKAAGFSTEQVESGALPCVDCKLKDWGSHPQRDTPWCSEQHTFALLLPMDEDDPTGAPALLTMQRSAIKPSKQYLTAFARSKSPLYTVRTKITLTGQRRGSVDFAVPKFVKMGATDSDMWPEFADQYRMIRDFVQTPSTRDDDDVTTTPVAVDEKGKPEAPAEPATVVEADDDLPF